MTDTSLASEADSSAVDFEPHVETFLEGLSVAGYSMWTLRKKRWIATAFALWLRREQVALVDLNESCVAAFGAAYPDHQKPASRSSEPCCDLSSATYAPRPECCLFPCRLTDRSAEHSSGAT